MDGGRPIFRVFEAVLRGTEVCEAVMGFVLVI